MIVVLLKDEYNQKFMQLLVVFLTLLCEYNVTIRLSQQTEKSVIRRNQQKERKTTGGMMKPNYTELKTNMSGH